MIPNPEDRKDIVQDIYFKTYKNLSGFRFDAKLSTWIGQIAYTTALNFLEKKKLVLPGRSTKMEEDDQEGLEPLVGIFRPPHIHEPEALVFQKELIAILQEETGKLSPIYKTMIGSYTTRRP